MYHQPTLLLPETASLRLLIAMEIVPNFGAITPYEIVERTERDLEEEVEEQGKSDVGGCVCVGNKTLRWLNKTIVWLC